VHKATGPRHGQDSPYKAFIILQLHAWPFGFRQGRTACTVEIVDAFFDAQFEESEEKATSE
jgi:hypothetical protein